MARANAERALASGLSVHLEQDRVRALLRDDPKRLKYIPAEDRDRLVDTPFAEELSTLDPISVLRFAKQFLTRTRLEDIAERAFVENARSQGFDVAQWSTFRLPESRLANYSSRLFTVPLGQLGQGWTSALSVERTNLRESGRIYGPSDFLVQAVQYSFDNVTESQAEALARNCVLSWDFLQVQLDIGVLADWHYNNTYKGGCYFYERELRKKQVYPVACGPMLLKRDHSFAILARFGTHTPDVGPVPVQGVDSNAYAPSLRVTLCGRWA